MKQNHLITQDIKKLIFQIAIPSSIGMFFNTMYNVVDTFYVGLISTAAISALSYSFVVYFMLLSISFGLSTAISVYVGNSLGKYKKTLAKIYINNGISLFFIVSIFIYLLTFFILEDIFLLMGAKSDVLKLSLEYTHIILIGTIPMLLGLGANAVLIALGDTRSYRNSLIAGFFLNLILDPLFIYGYGFIPTFGFKGVAYATLITQSVTFIYIFYKLLQTNLLDMKTFLLNKPNIKAYKKLIIQAIPSSANMFLMSLGTIIITYFVSDYGYEAVAAFGIGYRVEQIILLPMLGLNTAVATLVANNYGAKHFSRIEFTISKALKYGYILSFFGVLFLTIFGKYIVMLFTKDVYVIDIAYDYIIVESFIFFSFITIFVSNSTLQGIKKPFVIPYISFYRQILMPSIILYFIVKLYKLDIIYIWISMFFIVLSASIFIYSYMKRTLEELKQTTTNPLS